MDEKTQLQTQKTTNYATADPYNNPRRQSIHTNFMSNSYSKPYYGYGVTPGDPYYRK